MTAATPYSLPEGVDELSGAAVGYGRIAAWAEPDRAFVWTAEHGWLRLEEVCGRIAMMSPFPDGVAVVTESPDGVGFWRGDTGVVSWWRPEPGVSVVRRSLHGDSAFLYCREPSGLRLVVLSARSGKWRVTASAPFSTDEFVYLTYEGENGIEVVTSGGLWVLDPGGPESTMRKTKSRNWEDPGPSGWSRACGQTVVESSGEPVRVLSAPDGTLVPRGVALLPGGEELLESFLAGNRALLATQVEFLARLPRPDRSPDARLLALLSDGVGPVAAVTSLGVIRDGDGALLGDLEEDRAGGRALVSPNALVGWRLAATPEGTINEAARHLLVLVGSTELAYGLFEVAGPGAFARLLRSVRGGEPLCRILLDDGLRTLLALCGPVAASSLREGLESEDENELLIAVVALRAEETGVPDEIRKGHGLLFERLTALTGHPEAFLRREALCTIGELRLTSLFEVVARGLDDVDPKVRVCAVETLLMLDATSDETVKRVGRVCTEDLDSDVRYAVATCLAAAAGERWTPFAVGSLRDADESVRIGAAKALAKAAGRLGSDLVMDVVDAALLEVAADRWPSRGGSGSTFSEVVRLPYRLLRAVADSVDGEDEESFWKLPSEPKRTLIRLGLLRSISGGLLGDELPWTVGAIAAEVDVLREMLAGDPDPTLRELCLSRGEVAALERGDWGGPDLAAFTLRMQRIDGQLADRLAIATLLRVGRRSDASRGAASRGRSRTLVDRLRSASRGRTNLDQVVERVRSMAESEDRIAPLAALALAGYEFDPGGWEPLRRWVRTGRWSEWEAVLPRLLRLLPAVEAPDLLMDALSDRKVTLAARVRVERATQCFSMTREGDARFQAFLEEVVAFRRLHQAG